MRKLPAFAFAGVAAATLAGTALAAAPKTHMMNVSLPDGSVARVEYVGDVAPKVTVAAGPAAAADMPWATPFPAFAGIDRMIQEMNRRSEEMMRRAQQTAHQAPGAAPYIASYGNLPAGETSTTVVSVSNGGGTCTRTTQMVSQGPGKPPKVTSNVSGDCGSAAAPVDGPRHPA
ncbi:MAG TPA: hypothetical protein VFW35_13070 [Sphingomicrobium sp.]|nr:hypothetical protein [Sphingomicrobium sp.]